MTGGSAPGGPADDDVLGRRPLHDHRVDDDVERDREQRQERREEVDEPGEDDERHDAEDEAEDDGPLRVDLVGRQRPAAGPDHQLVDVAVEVAVDRVRAARRERPADERPDRQPRPVAELDAGHLAGREDHRRDGRHEQQLDDPRLRERDVGTQRVGAGPGDEARLAIGRPAARLRRAGLAGRSGPGPAPCGPSSS